MEIVLHELSFTSMRFVNFMRVSLNLYSYKDAAAVHQEVLLCARLNVFGFWSCTLTMGPHPAYKPSLGLNLS